MFEVKYTVGDTTKTLPDLGSAFVTVVTAKDLAESPGVTNVTITIAGDHAPSFAF